MWSHDIFLQLCNCTKVVPKWTVVKMGSPKTAAVMALGKCQMDIKIISYRMKIDQNLSNQMIVCVQEAFDISSVTEIVGFWGVYQNCTIVRYFECEKVTSTSSNYIAKPWNPSSFYSNSSNSFAFKRFSAPKALVLSSLALHLALNLHFFRFIIDYEICHQIIIYKLYNNPPIR